MRKILLIGLAGLVLSCTPVYYEMKLRISNEKIMQDTYYVYTKKYSIKRLDGKPATDLPKGELKIRFPKEGYDAEALDDALNKNSEIKVKVKQNFRQNESPDFDVLDIIKY